MHKNQPQLSVNSLKIELRVKLPFLKLNHGKIDAKEGKPAPGRSWYQKMIPTNPTMSQCVGIPHLFSQFYWLKQLISE